jgi:hypothetical protein
MAELFFEVDTAPMARSVDSVKGHVHGVTAAVAAMEAAVIATERQSAKTISEHVDTGFYTMVKSQISQKAVAAYTEMTTKQMILFQLVKALDSVKRQMESDYNMISRRYAKLFQSLNKALESRIKELDRPAMKLAEIRKNIVFDKLKDDASLLLSASSEILSVVQTALSGKLKQKTRETLRTLSESITEEEFYRKKISSILQNRKYDSGKKDISKDPQHADSQYIPGIVSAAESLLNTDDCIENIYTPQSETWQNAPSMVSEINRISRDLAWVPTRTEDKDMVRKEFMALCEKECTDERLSKEIRRLFDESSWEEAQP